MTRTGLQWLQAWWWLYRTERLPLWIAKRLPARLVYWCFICVHANAEAWWSFADVARAWEARYRLDRS